jgi:hypothetical protein
MGQPLGPVSEEGIVLLAALLDGDVDEVAGRLSQREWSPLIVGFAFVLAMRRRFESSTVGT